LDGGIAKVKQSKSRSGKRKSATSLEIILVLTNAILTQDALRVSRNA
jgi:hypothetical protein